MRYQKGMTLMGMLFTVAVVVAVGVTSMRVVPVYIQYFAIAQSIKGLNEVPQSAFTGDPIGDTDVLRSSLLKRLDINEIDYIKEENVRIEPSGVNRFKVFLKYQVVRPLVYNVSLLFNFERTQEVVIRGEN